MKTIKQLLITATMLFFSIIANAHIFEVDDIYYDFGVNDNEVYVSYQGNSYTQYLNEYFGSVEIPSTVTYNNKKYKVTGIMTVSIRRNAYCSV